MYMLMYDGTLHEAVPWHFDDNSIGVGLRFYCSEEEGGEESKVTIVMTLAAIESMKKVLMRDKVMVGPSGEVIWRNIRGNEFVNRDRFTLSGRDGAKRWDEKPRDTRDYPLVVEGRLQDGPENWNEEIEG